LRYATISDQEISGFYEKLAATSAGVSSASWLLLKMSPLREFFRASPAVRLPVLLPVLPLPIPFLDEVELESIG
jgi:hypothetical protein